jgi:hypothetical protein
MGFDNGTINLTPFYLPEELPENYLERFNHNAGKKLSDLGIEPEIAWSAGQTFLECEIDESSAILGGHLYLNMRIAERKIPAGLLKAICRSRELKYMVENSVDIVPSRERKIIREEVIEINLIKMFPTVSAIPFVIDLASKMLYFGGSSAKQIDSFIELFKKTTGIEPYQLTLNELLIKHYQSGEKELPQIKFTDIPDEPQPSWDFLTWLLYIEEKENGGELELDNYGVFKIFFQGPASFAIVSDDIAGAGETTVKKKNPLESQEAKAALTMGKRLKKVKMTIYRGEEQWSGTFDADKFTFSSLGLPDGEELEPHARFAERIQSLHIFQEVFTAYFKRFHDVLTADDWKETEEKIREWIKNRKTL